MRVPTRKGKRIEEDKGEYFVSEVALERMKSTLKDLQAQVPIVAEDKSRAAALGDRSENAEYQEAKARLSSLHTRILSLQDRLSRAVVIPGSSDSSMVEVGSKVTVEVDGREQIFEIVGSLETNPAKGRISNTSPLGKALIGHIPGDEITFKTPGGVRLYKILSLN